MIEQPLAVRRQQIGQQHQAIALGEQHEELAERPAPACTRATTSATAAFLRGAGTAGFRAPSRASDAG